MRIEIILIPVCVVPSPFLFPRLSSFLSYGHRALVVVLINKIMVSMTPTSICRFFMVILACLVLYLYLHFVLMMCLVFVGFYNCLQLLYCLDVCIVSGPRALLH